MSIYDGALITNVERLAQDDGKGAGEGIMTINEHTFHQKFGVVNTNKDIERIWQRKYDEPLLAYISTHN